MSEFWQSFWFIVEIFLFLAYLMVLFHIFADLFRDSKLNGWIKALWVVILMVLPLFGSLIYLISRGQGMNQRSAAAAAAAQRATTDYIREAAGRSPAQEIADAQALFEKGAITRDEFAMLKSKALS